MRTFNDYKNYLDYFILENYNYINELEIVRENAYVCLLHYLKKYSKLDDMDFIEKLNKEFYGYLFKYTVRNIDLFTDISDRETLSIRAFLYYYKKYKKYPTITDIYMLYGISKTNAYNIAMYASPYLDIDVTKKDIYQEPDTNDINQLIDNDFYEDILRRIINDPDIDEKEIYILLLKCGYYDKKFSNGAIASMLGMEKDVVKESIDNTRKKVLIKYNKDFYL